MREHGDPTRSTRTTLFAENIFVSPGSLDAVIVSDPGCMFDNNLMYPQATSVGTNTIVADPMFVAPHLRRLSSPGRKSGDRSRGFRYDGPEVDHDAFMRTDGERPAHGPRRVRIPLRALSLRRGKRSTGREKSDAC